MPEDNVLWLKPNQPPHDDRIYYREDDREILGLLTGPTAIHVYLGLRRFGKTSFLKRVQRVCAQRPDLKEWSASFHLASDAPPNFIRGLQRALSDAEGKRHVFLIDDLMFLETHLSQCQDADKRKEWIDNLNESLELVFDAVTNSSGRQTVVLAEPTIFFDWLKSARGDWLVGPRLSDEVKLALVGDRKWLHALDAESTRRLLSAEQGGVMHITGLSEELVFKVWTETGGNPWLLAHAQQALKQDPDLKDGAGDKLVDAVERRIEMAENAGMYDSIFNSLSSTEQFVLRLLVDPSSDGYSGSAKWPWIKSRGLALGYRMAELGLIKKSDDGCPSAIRSSIMERYLKKRFRSDPVGQSRVQWIQNEWESVLTLAHPVKKPSFCIIHQFADTFFHTPNSHEPWIAYIKHLRTLSPRDRPHIVVICGNVLSAPTFIHQWHEFTEKLSRAFKQLVTPLAGTGEPQALLQATRYPQPSVLPEQVFVVPGVYDIPWNDRELLPADVKDPWAHALLGRDLEPVHYPIPNVTLVPFDTVSATGIDEAAQQELLTNRIALAEKFKACLDSDNHVLTDPNMAETFARKVLFYTSGLEGTKDLEYGHVAAKTLEKTIKSVKDQGRTPSLRIAVAHHCPRQPDPFYEAEFESCLRWREELAKNGIHLVLHGHSPLQTCLVETISGHTGASSKPTAFHLLGPGSFVSTASLSDTQGNGGKTEPPTFNEIRIQWQAPDKQDTPPTTCKVFVFFADIDRDEVRKVDGPHFDLSAV